MHALSGNSAILLSVDLQNSTAGFGASVGIDLTWQAAYSNHFVKVDYQTPALTQFKIGTVKTNDQAFDMG